MEFPPWLAVVSDLQPNMLACVHIMGTGLGPLTFLATTQREQPMSPSEFCLNPLLKTFRVDLAFFLAHFRRS